MKSGGFLLKGVNKMKKITIMIIALLAAPKLHAAKVCVSEEHFKEMVRNVLPNNYYCSYSAGSRTGSGGYCWCFASGSWSYSGNNTSSGICPGICPDTCGV
jgi:hypothetical protein